MRWKILTEEQDDHTCSLLPLLFRHLSQYCPTSCRKCLKQPKLKFHFLLFSSSLTDDKDKPKNNIVLVQEHYYSNDPITNVIYRYGDLNQLTFALPKRATFQKYLPLRFHPSFVDTSLTFSNEVNMLINPTYRYETLRRFMPKV